MVERRTLLLGGAALVTGVAVSPPFDDRAGHDLVGHMVQHLVLLGLAGPLVVVAGLSVWRRPDPLPLAWSFAGAAAELVVVVVWHLPVLFDAADRSVPIHVVEHLSFIAASAALWWCAGLGRRPAPLGATLVVFVASLPGLALGAAMTLSATPWYSAYASLTQQQVAGALMWSVGGLVSSVCGVLSFSRAVAA